MLIHGDSLGELKKLEENSIDSVVTDPPYGLAFMGKKWDYDVPSVELWREVLRVLKPGGYLLSFGGTRTYHRMVVNIEDAGFEIRDQLQWLYGSGFPKSHNISKAIDKKKGLVREVVGPKKDSDGRCRAVEPMADDMYIANGKTLNASKTKPSGNLETKPASPEAKQWDGFGTALKPANEPIVLARKPFKGTVADNVLKHGVGGLNIDGCRVEVDPNDVNHRGPSVAHNYSGLNTIGDGLGKRDRDNLSAQGRFPANLILDEVAAEMLDGQSGDLGKSSGGGMKRQKKNDKTFGEYGLAPQVKNCGKGDSGGASRFFYCAKASKSERGGSSHPTMKPIKLMKYLIRLVTPPGGTCLDPFMGSGTTGVAAKLEGFIFVGVERESEYIKIAEKRISCIQSTV